MRFKSSSPSKKASSMNIDEFSGDQCLSSAACSSFMADQKSIGDEAFDLRVWTKIHHHRRCGPDR
jgi:hypothetical protein